MQWNMISLLLYSQFSGQISYSVLFNLIFLIFNGASLSDKNTILYVLTESESVTARMVSLS